MAVADIENVVLGNSTLSVSRMGLGLAALGRPGYITLGHGQDLAHSYAVGAMEAQAHALLDLAYARGIRYFDTARSYGRAEAFLGSWLRKNPEAAEEVAVGSKWGYRYTAGWQVDADVHEEKEHSLARLARQWGETKQHLGDDIHLYQIHSATLESGVLDNNAVLDELARMRTQEQVMIGLSVTGKDQSRVIEKALEVQRDGCLLFGSVQATFNILEPTAGPLLADAKALGVGVIVKEALANGRLTERNQAPGFADKLRLLQAQALQAGMPLDTMALSWVLGHSFVDVVLSGAVLPQHLLTNIQALGKPLPDDVHSALSVLQQPSVAYWTQRSALAWN